LAHIDTIYDVTEITYNGPDLYQMFNPKKETKHIEYDGPDLFHLTDVATKISKKEAQTSSKFNVKYGMLKY
jgi:hypothetical protein